MLVKYTLYETKHRFFLVGSDQEDSVYKIMKIDRTTSTDLNITTDETFYSKKQTIELIQMIHDGNKHSGGLQKVGSYFGLIGFIKFLEGYYIILINKRSAVALIGGHYIYHIDDTEMLRIFSSTQKTENSINEESLFTEISIFGHNIFITLIARRSRFFAGARFLKRGTNDQGHVANDVETEQIVQNAKTTSFLTNSPKPNFTSFVQHRGSIPLYWSQDNVSLAPKPPIELSIVDPYFSAAALHFDNLFSRYNSPIIVLNLVKKNEKIRRESILLDEFSNAIAYLNQFLPPDDKIQYIAWDMARASKSQDQDVIGKLQEIAEKVLSTTQFFISGSKSNEGRRQKGVARTNCIDCLDRTNAAQFVIGKCALGKQLKVMGILSNSTVPFDSDATNLLNAMYHDHGDTIALQYGGSHLVNTMETYRKLSPWTSHSRDMLESIKRYYNNSFTDADKQDSFNLFLGNYIPNKKSHIWDMQSDFYLHNDHPEIRRPKRSYINWYSKKNLNTEKPLICKPKTDSYYTEYYRPTVYTSFKRLFAYNIIGTNTRAVKEEVEISPFTERVSQQQPQPRHFTMYTLNIGGVKGLLTFKQDSELGLNEEIEAATENAESKPNTVDTSPGQQTQQQSQWFTTSALATRLMNPNVPENELKEYRRYIKPHNSQNFFFIDSETTQNFKFYQDYCNLTFYTDPLKFNECFNVKDELIFENFCGFEEKYSKKFSSFGFSTNKKLKKKNDFYKNYMESTF
ncbi:phosphatidylinositol-3,5-bisphosphate 5-phosphatase [Clydaea vesicula]|uniref:Phosphatidylinositol-3,5-bisphosphate 5-phosphatase n=1 Tax=Clydaea vesicula TaxID=447962 RepID=A0AAD5U3G4_9FUNG|nr:phosphatidylinositol-3,5-bisphosphate 5-phosphatase [Clydaea vesicula]